MDSLNRTFVELKLFAIDKDGNTVGCLNRTFVELKHSDGTETSTVTMS